MLVVKDDAYGHGLERDRPRGRRPRACAGSARSTCREALRTRAAAGPEARVFSWLTVGRDRDRARRSRPTSTSASAMPASSRTSPPSRREAGAAARVHLKIDTGLHRNGIRPEDWAGGLGRARALEDAGRRSRIVGVWSHIAEASDDEDDAARAAVRRRGRRCRGRRIRPSRSATSPPAPRRSRGPSSATTSCASARSATASGPPAVPDEPELGIRPIAALSGARDARRRPRGDARRRRRSHGLPSTLAKRADARRRGRPRERASTSMRHTSVVEPWPHARDRRRGHRLRGRRRRPRPTSRRRSEPSARRSSSGCRRSFRAIYRGE